MLIQLCSETAYLGGLQKLRLSTLLQPPPSPWTNPRLDVNVGKY